MPGRFFLTTTGQDLATALGVDAVPPDAPRRNIAPGQSVIALTDAGAAHMRWGMIPVGRVNARGRPVMETIVNARGETVFAKGAFDGTGRAVVPADGWYEWTGATRRKSPWAIRRGDGGLLYFAAISDVWHGPGGIEVAQVATVTCAPSADVRAIHDRMGVILTRDQIVQWLQGDKDAAQALVRPFPDGTLTVTAATDVDWTKP